MPLPTHVANIDSLCVYILKHNDHDLIKCLHVFVT